MWRKKEKGRATINNVFQLDANSNHNTITSVESYK